MTTPTGLLFGDPQTRPLSTTGIPQAGCYWCFFLTGTTTPANVYADGALSTPLSQPTPGAVNPTGGTVANSAGLFVPIYLNPATTYRVQLYNAGGSKLEDTDPYVVSSIAAATIGLALYPQTAAEISASITPTSYLYPEGDIRRYGALVSASDNSGPITNALSVSAAGGAAAYIPGGTWATANPCVAAPGSSIYGAGKSSIILAANGIDGIQQNSSDSGIVANARFIRDFQIVGTLSGSTNAAHGLYLDAGTIIVNVTNVTVINFQYGIWAQGLSYSSFNICYIQNCFNAIYFNDQSINVFINSCTLQYTSAGTLITASGNSAGITVTGSPEVEGLHIYGGSIYGFYTNINLGLVFECQIEALDISAAGKYGILMESSIGGVWIRDCWIETNNGIAGGSGTSFGILITAVTPSVNAKVLIEANYIHCDTPYSQATGVYLGNDNAGVVVKDNQIFGYDIGVGGGNNSTFTGGALTGSVIKNNTINVVSNTTGTGVYSTTSAAVLLNSLSLDCEVGPNYIVNGNGAAATIAGSSTITVPTQATSTNQQFPVGTPVQCTSSIANGPIAGVTYWVITSSTTAVTIGATAAGSAISWGGTGSIGSLVQAPIPWNYNSSTPTGMTLFGRGSFIGALSDPAVTGQIYWVASGKTITLTPAGAMTGSAGATTMTMAGLPGYLAPNTTQDALCGVENNTAAAVGLARFSSAAGISFFATLLAGAFTNSGTKGLLTPSITYTTT